MSMKSCVQRSTCQRAIEIPLLLASLTYCKWLIMTDLSHPEKATWIDKRQSGWTPADQTLVVYPREESMSILR